MDQVNDIAALPQSENDRGASASAQAIHTAAFKLTVTVVAVAGTLLASAVIYPDQADLYDSAYIVSIIKQITRETEFQPLYLVIVLAPLFVAAARNVGWIALASGGLIMISILLPYAQFQYVEISTGEVKGVHSSLYQLAGPGHHMPQFVSVLVLMMMAGITALYWRVRIGGLIGVMGAVTTAFVWPAVFDEPPLIDGRAAIIFENDTLEFGYYVAWLGAAIAIIGRDSILARLSGRFRTAGGPPHDIQAGPRE